MSAQPHKAWERIVEPVMIRLCESGDWPNATFSQKVAKVSASCAVAQGKGITGDMMQGWLLAQILEGYVPREPPPGNLNASASDPPGPEALPRGHVRPIDSGAMDPLGR